MQILGGLRVLLYEDDVVFTLQDPITSIYTLSKELTHFGEVSGYHINDSKSVMMALNVT